ncbi:MAG: DUF72 domain-containing protein [Gemmatimonadota bacterium]|nr:DUF72 domain-containing protein [Gemmatimonadota bacterium]MDH4349682.1 DUF72 domain-containing protein [Gemmatimonadota bacterium]MDH5196985.1 DUF72 domain-containing protein [Gemmatimonadota bacterium]
MAVLRVGTQGWNYPAWVGPFYPAGTRAADMLGLYARAFPTVEIDSTFYAPPAEPVVRAWAARVPADFVFALKVPQEITHERRLVDVRESLDRFVSRARLLEDRLGPLLIQMPPDWPPSADTRAVLADFLAQLATDLRWAIEFRDPRWLDDATLGLLRTHRTSLALVEGRWVKRERMLALAAEPTADFAYVRWMGPDRALSDYSHVQVRRERELALWGDAVDALRSRVREVFGYFNNHFQGHSPESARTMQTRLGLPVVDPVSLRQQGELF